MSKLVPESKRLLQLEKVIKAGQQTFVEVGSALAEIRNSELYKLEHDTFEEYCREKWGWTKTYSNYLIEGSKVVKSLPENLTTIVVTETQARALAKAPAESRPAILEKVAAAGKVTAKAIQEAIEVERPRVETLDEKWGNATGGIKLPEPELTPLQIAVTDLDYVCNDHKDNLKSAKDKAEFKARLIHWSKEF